MLQRFPVKWRMVSEPPLQPVKQMITHEPVMMRHKLIVNTSVIYDDYKVYENDQKYSLIYQLTRLTRDKGALAHDDRLDAVTMAVAFWLESLDRDAQQGIDELEEEQLMKWWDSDFGILHKEYNPELVPERYRKRQPQFGGATVVDNFYS